MKHQLMEDVLTDVKLERKRQHDKWGEQRMLDTDRRCELKQHGVSYGARTMRNICEYDSKHGTSNRLTILMEEVAEAAEEGHADKVKTELLYEEVIQVAAVAVAWAEDIKERMQG